MANVDKITLVTPLKGSHFDLLRHLEDFKSFVQKLPVTWELILVCHDAENVSNTLAKVGGLADQKPKIELKVLSNQSGRGPSVLEGLKASTGDIVCVFPLDWTVPLAEMFQFLQELVVHPHFDMVLGNRKTSKKKQTLNKTSWHQTLENILFEKLNLSQTDPLSPYWGIRKTSLEKLLPSLKFKSWYYTPELLQAAQAAGLNIVEAPVLSKDSRPSQIPLLREFLRAAF